MYSSAHGNVNVMTGQPDPQTGLYTFNYPVAELLSHSGFGPKVSFQLTFSSLSSYRQVSNPDENPLMLGAGWQVNLTQYNSTTERLTLGTGQSYVKLSESSGEWVLDYTLKDIRINEEADNIYVYHKDGTLETLTYINDSHDADRTLLEVTYDDGLTIFTRYPMTTKEGKYSPLLR